MWMKIMAILIAAVALLFSCSGQKKVHSEVVEKTIHDFFDTYAAKGPTEALNALLPTNPYITQDVTDSVTVRLGRLTKDMGKFEGFEKINENSYGESIVMFTYLVKYSRQPLRFNFKFYKPGDVWKLHHFTYEADFLNELDEAARAYRLEENSKAK